MDKADDKNDSRSPPGCDAETLGAFIFGEVHGCVGQGESLMYTVIVDRNFRGLAETISFKYVKLDDGTFGLCQVTYSGQGKQGILPHGKA